MRLIASFAILAMASAAAAEYVENFNAGPGGWLGWISNRDGAKALPIRDGAIVSDGPWWIDYNHAPPGGGYLHLLFALHTFQGPNFPEQYRKVGGANRFVEGAFPRDFRNARVRVRLRGELAARGAKCVFLAQSKVRGRYVNYVLTGQPLDIQSAWTWHDLRLTTDPAQWTALGSRQDRLETYSDAPISEVLSDLNGDIIFVLFPLNVRPLRPLKGNMHALKAGEDYEVDRTLLPSGWVAMDEIRIAFPERSATK